jgi:hypothetical protein
VCKLGQAAPASILDPHMNKKKQAKNTRMRESDVVGITITHPVARRVQLKIMEMQDASGLSAVYWLAGPQDYLGIQCFYC